MAAGDWVGRPRLDVKGQGIGKEAKDRYGGPEMDVRALVGCGGPAMGVRGFRCMWRV